MICLDTNVVIGVMNRRPASLTSTFESKVASRDLALPALVLFELEYGVSKSDRRDHSAARLATFLRYPVTIVPFETPDASEACDILATLERAGMPIGPYDVLIAAQARRRGATLVTADTREFSRVPGLVLEDWTIA